MYAFVFSAYEEPFSLFCGDAMLPSQEGVQQGDPLGPLLFCLTIYPLIQQLTSEFRLFYLDDRIMGGCLSDILHDLQNLEVLASDLGLRLNQDKSELFCSDPATRREILSTVPGLHVLFHDEVAVLGSPVGVIESLSGAILEKVERLHLMGDRLHLMHAHDALLLLRHSFSMPKILHMLQIGPCFLFPAVEAYDFLLRRVLGDITNVCLEEDGTWTQASLPVGVGGIGIRRAAQLAPSAFLASAAGCFELIAKILTPQMQGVLNPSRDAALTAWQHGHDEVPPSSAASHRQKAWDAPLIQGTYDALMMAAFNPSTRARLLAVASKEAGAWLTALPISSLGLRMDDEVVRIAIGLRLGVALCVPHCCQHCGSDVDEMGTHGLSCRLSKGRHSRHAAINDTINRSLNAAKIPCLLEPNGLYRSDSKRPDGTTMVPWSGGKVLVWDATFPDTLAPYTSLATREAGAVAEETERRKKAKHTSLFQSL